MFSLIRSGEIKARVDRQNKHQNFPKNLKRLDQTFSDVSRRFQTQSRQVQIVQISSLQTFADLVQMFVTYPSNLSDALSSQSQTLPKLSRTSALHATAINWATLARLGLGSVMGIDVGFLRSRVRSAVDRSC